MFDIYDESDLLGYIEDTLDETAARNLRQQLAQDPQVAELIEQMRRDRAMLATDPEPQLPEDFIEQLEPMLVRPMLMDSPSDVPISISPHRPGEQRRKQRRARQRRLLQRLSVAAAIMLLVVGGVWVAANQLLPRSAPQLATQRVDADSSRASTVPDSSDALNQVIDARDPWLVPGAVVHHHLPELGSHAGMVYGQPSKTPTVSLVDVAALPQLVLLFQSSDVRETEAVLTATLSEQQRDLALVQNFSYEEARQLEQAWFLASGQQRPTQRSDDIAASSRGVSPQRMEQLANRATQQYRTARPNTPIEAELSRQLLGHRADAASFIEQLEFSSRGATHTLSLRAHDLSTMLAELATVPNQQTSLHLLPSAGEPLDPTSWLQQREQVQQVLRQLRHAPEDAIIHLPIRLQMMD